MSSISRNCASPLRAARRLADGPYTRAWKFWCEANPDPVEDTYLSIGTSTFFGKANSRSNTTTSTRASISTNGRNDRRVEFRDLDLILRDESEKSTESTPVRCPVQQSPDCVQSPPFKWGPVFRYLGPGVPQPHPSTRQRPAFALAGRPAKPLSRLLGLIAGNDDYFYQPKIRPPRVQAWIRKYGLDMEIPFPDNLPPSPPPPSEPHVATARAPTPTPTSTFEIKMEDARKQGWTRPWLPPIGWIPGEPLVPLDDMRCDYIDDGHWSTSEESEYSTQPGSNTLDEPANDDDVHDSSDNL